MDDNTPPESPKHSDLHTEESSVIADGLSRPAGNAAFNPAESSFSVLASPPRANPFTQSNFSRRRLSLTGSRFDDHSFDLLRDHSDSSILHHHSSQFDHGSADPCFDSNYQIQEMARNDDRVLQARDIAPPEVVDQNQHGINRYSLQFEDIQQSTGTTGFHNIPENTCFQWFTPYNLQVQEPVSQHNSVAPTPRGPIYHGQPIFDQRRPPNPDDNAAGFENLLCSSSSTPKFRNTSHDSTTTGFIRGLSSPTSSGSESVDSNHETGEMATGLLPPLSLEQLKEHLDLQRWERLMQQRSDIVPSTFSPQAQVDQNQHGINTFGLQFKDIQHNATTLASSFHNRPENTFHWCTPYNSQLQEPVSLHNFVAPRPIFDQRPLKPDNAGFENLCLSSPKSKKMLLNTTAGNNNDVHCQCAKTSCLKLYCECFSAETYCDDLCKCQRCKNREDYKDTIEDTKEKIGILKPNAFHPKIQHGDRTGFTTSSLARHKRGCNCKRSKCLKKYCECYQANVGCCHVCRCENCENTHGKKEDYLARKHGTVVAPTPTAPPAFQSSNYAEAAPNSWNEAGPSTAATPYGINHLQLPPAYNNIYGVNDELMMSGTGFHMQQHDHPVGGGDPMNEFSQNVDGFGVPNPENWVINTTTNAGILFSHNGQIPTANAQMFSHNAQMLGQIPNANAQMLGQIPTTVNPFHTEEENNVFYGSAAAGGVYNIPANSSKDAAHQMFEESPTLHPNAAVLGSSGNMRVSVHSHETPTPTPVNHITSSSARAGEMSGYNYQSRDAPSSKGFDGGHTHTAKKD